MLREDTWLLGPKEHNEPGRMATLWVVSHLKQGGINQPPPHHLGFCLLQLCASTVALPLLNTLIAALQV